jgi:hypothetical protein
LVEFLLVFDHLMFQFVPLRNFLNSASVDGNWAMSQAMLAKEVLAEVPAQLTGWMRSRNVQAHPPVHVDEVQLQMQPAPSEPLYPPVPPVAVASGHPGQTPPPVAAYPATDPSSQPPSVPQSAVVPPYPQQQGFACQQAPYSQQQPFASPYPPYPVS